MPREVTGVAAVAMDGKLLVIGAGFSSSAVLQYDPEDRSWKELPSLLTVRYGSTVTVLGGDLVVMGGRDPASLTSLVERYNRRLQCWEAMPSLIDPLIYSAAVVVRV